jgi:hypothetical protein
MGLTIELTSREEASLRQLAAESGQTPERLAQEAVRTHLSARSLNTLSQELSLLSRLAIGLPDEVWRRYHGLNRKLREETIGEQELQEFLKLNEQVEAWNAERMQLAFEISKIRSRPFNETLEQLGMLRKPD